MARQRAPIGNALRRASRTFIRSEIHFRYSTESNGLERSELLVN
jgi:hypothetical protein